MNKNWKEHLEYLKEYDPIHYSEITSDPCGSGNDDNAVFTFITIILFLIGFSTLSYLSFPNKSINNTKKERSMKDQQYLYNAYNATSTDDGKGNLETYENWLERQLLSRIEKLDKIESKDLLNEALNKALIGKNSIKGIPNSNKIADFVNKNYPYGF